MPGAQALHVEFFHFLSFLYSWMNKILHFLSVDSGGQYLDGTTTDVTRTMHYGVPSAEMVEMYTRQARDSTLNRLKFRPGHRHRIFHIHHLTRVLMGHIDLARTVLPSGTSDYIMDYASRQPLYRDCIDAI